MSQVDQSSAVSMRPAMAACHRLMLQYLDVTHLDKDSLLTQIQIQSFAVISLVSKVADSIWHHNTSFVLFSILASP